MANSVTYEAETGVIMMRLAGTIDQHVLTSMAGKAARLAKKHNCYLLLNDARRAFPALTTLEIYELPNTVEKLVSAIGLPVSKFKRAIVVAGEMDDFTFFETVSRNHGQHVMLFRDMDEARKWLLEK